MYRITERMKVKRGLTEKDIMTFSSREDEASQDFEFDDAKEGDADIHGFEDGNPEDLPDAFLCPSEGATESDMS